MVLLWAASLLKRKGERRRREGQIEGEEEERKEKEQSPVLSFIVMEMFF